jgi:predicted NBD/HSP70 family sugar kinase
LAYKKSSRLDHIGQEQNSVPGLLQHDEDRSRTLMRTETHHKLRMLGVEDVREANELKLLHIIRDRQPISRADLVNATVLRPGTVSVVVNRLLRASVVYEGEPAPSSGGRPATYLQINAEKAYVVGISIGVQHTVYGVGDFNGRILNQRTVRTNCDAAKFLTELGNEIASQLKSNFRRARMTGVGVSVPGLIDRVEGRLVRSPNLGWRNVPIASLLEDILGLPVQVENDANAAALSELWYGPMEIWSAHCMLFVLIVEGVGIGTGLILNGEVYVGSRIGLGGFGHIPMDPKGPKCSCGSIGCWEALASDEAALARFAASCEDPDKQVDSLHDLIALAQSGDNCARQELVNTASLIGRGIKALAQGLAPEVVVIGGQITTAWSTIEPVLLHELQGEYLVPGLSRPQLRPASVEQPSFFGAFPVALRSVLHKPKKTARV